MSNKQTINMFWSGNNWTYLHHLTILSHIYVDHHINMWIHGDIPNSKYWCEYDNMTILDADDIIDISWFLNNGGNIKTASSLFRWNLLYQNGGWYADTDAIAVNTWPNDDVVFCGEYPGQLSTGVIKSQPNDPLFLDMIDSIKYKWGNVGVFNDMCIKHRGDNKSTHDNKLFYPFGYKEWDIWLKPYTDNGYKDVYSIHLFHTMFERAGIIDDIEQWIYNNPNSLLGIIKSLD